MDVRNLMNSDIHLRTSKIELQSELDISRRSRQSRNLPSLGNIDVWIGKAEVSRVRQVEKFGPKLEPDHFGHSEILV